jgi:galactose oxidase-like protein
VQLINKKFRGPFKGNWVLALFSLGFISRPAAIAQTPGTFTRTGDMTTMRENHTTTRLSDGRVLIAGGVTLSFSSITNTAELYDPITGVFTPTGEMTTPRRSHAATLLPDGRVLIAGGFGPLGAESVGCPPSLSFGCPLASGELYDPSTGTFTATGDMIANGVASGGAQAILLPNGKVFIALNLTAQLYDPPTGTFVAAAPYVANAPAVYTATLLADGRILVTGCDLPSCDYGVAELYDPWSDTFSITGPPNGRDVNDPKAILLNNGKVLFLGSPGVDLPAEGELYDPMTGIFAHLGHTIWPHDFFPVTLLPDGKVLIAGGQSLEGVTGAAEFYDPYLGTFAKTGSMVTPRYRHKSTLLADGRVLITGGYTSSAELYVPQAPVLWPQAITAMKTAAGSEILNFWQWAWYWQRSPAFTGAPAGFGVPGSIDNTPGMIDKIVAMGGGVGFLNISAEQWVLDYRHAVQANMDPR